MRQISSNKTLRVNRSPPNIIKGQLSLTHEPLVLVHFVFVVHLLIIIVIVDTPVRPAGNGHSDNKKYIFTKNQGVGFMQLKYNNTRDVYLYMG